jgi:NAD(P)H dehydrogenase (quinone)
MTKVRLSVIYYSATGTNYEMARAAEAAAAAAGADTRLRRVRELAPDEAIDRNPAWRAHVEATRDVVEATLDDLEWADGYLFGSPTRYGNLAAQLKQFIDTAGSLWSQGKLADKPVAAFTSARNPHGGQETTLLAMYNIFHHWGCLLVPPGYTDQAVFAAGGNPYGVSTTPIKDGRVDPAALEAVRYMAQRVTRVTQWLKAGRERAES